MEQPIIPALPISDVLEQLHSSLREKCACVLTAPTGAGKTTIVPLSLLEAPWLAGKTIVMLEPRRVAARAAAHHMAQLLGEAVGETVGYHVRNDHVSSSRSRILVVTEGILTRMLQHDPLLPEVGLCIFDEFHERNLHGDLALALALESQEAFRPDLRILVMSATLSVDPLMALLTDPALVVSRGRSFPVRVQYHPFTGSLVDSGRLTQALLGVIQATLIEPGGDLLVFLPGAGEIRRLAALLETLYSSVQGKSIYVAALYGAMDTKEQDKAITPSPPGMRKIVLATNIAETSLTIDGITIVIDSGLERVPYFNAGTGMDQLLTGYISSESAEQRRGRAGRTAPGTCHRLWNDSKNLIPRRPPEMLRSDLTQLVLELALWGVTDPSACRWIDAPPGPAVEAAQALLSQLGAIDTTGAITRHGHDIVRIGVHPRLAHMLLKANAMGLTGEAALIAALLQERHNSNSASRSTDLAERIIPLAAAWERQNGGTQNTPPVMLETQRLLRHFHSFGPPAGISKSHMTGLLLAFAYPDRIGLLREGETHRYLLSGGKGAKLHPSDNQARTPCLVFPAMDGASAEARVYLSAALEPDLIEEHFGDQTELVREIKWDPRERRVETSLARKFMSLTLGRAPYQNAPRDLVAQCLMDGIRSVGPSALPLDDKCLTLMARVGFHRHLFREHPGLVENMELPSFELVDLLSTLESWLK
ncbi:ATP-dependent helicase HrpB, partial [Myxococcota bacterium]|nr:ATP-dependent helicase HrpB [Myxococcota bacterium]